MKGFELRGSGEFFECSLATEGFRVALALPTLEHFNGAATRCVTRTASCVVLADATFQIISDATVKSAVTATNDVKRPNRGLRFDLVRHSSRREIENAPNFDRSRG